MNLYTNSQYILVQIKFLYTKKNGFFREIFPQHPLLEPTDCDSMVSSYGNFIPI